jgi:hypothetical protein
VSRIRLVLIVLSLSLPIVVAGCWIESELGETQVGGIDFVTPHVARGAAKLQILAATGYTCPDGEDAQIYLATPTESTGPYPIALLFHSRALDYVDIAGEHYASKNRLTASWAIEQARRSLGLATESGDPSLGEGAWAAALLEAGFAVAAPTNCWGDLWHGRGRNSIANEGFMRLGASLADDTSRIAADNADIDEDFAIAVGLGEGGRAITELALAEVPLRAVVVDSSPDLLGPLLDQPMINSAYIVGLSHIYNDEVGHLDEAIDQVAALQTFTNRDSVVHLVEDLEFRTPIVYAYSPTDPRINSLLSAPAAIAIESSYQSPPGAHRLLTWPESTHAQSNRSIDETRGLIAWILEQTGAHIPAPGDDDSASE